MVLVEVRQALSEYRSDRGGQEMLSPIAAHYRDGLWATVAAVRVLSERLNPCPGAG